MAIYIRNYNLHFTMDVTEKPRKIFGKDRRSGGRKKNTEKNTLILFLPLVPIFLLFSFLIEMLKCFFY